MKIKVLTTILCLISLPVALAQVNFTSSNLPIIVINTHGQTIPDEPKIDADMGIIYNGVGLRNNLTDPFNNFNGKIGIELRGSTSQDLFPKKQYGIEIRDVNGASIDASLLGLPKKDDWVLFAPYDDKSLMRDVLAYKLGRDLGRYASRSVYCEMVLNGEYMGVFVLLEKIKRDKNRVNIDKLDITENTGDNLTGGYILKLDKIEGSGGAGWNSPYPPPNRSGGQTTYFQYEYPKPADITAEQKTYIINYITQFENTLAMDNFKDPVNGYAKYIDVDSFVDYFIANELTRNPDAYRISTFMYKRKDSDGGKLFMGPIWDFNLGFGNVNFCAKEKPEGFIIDYNMICPSDGWLVPFWWSRLFEDPAFKTKVVTRWQTLRSKTYATSRITGYIDSVSNVLNLESQQRNFQRWPVLGQYVWPNSFVGPTFQSEVDWLKDWVSRRLSWMDANLPNVITTYENNPERFAVTASPNPFQDNITLRYQQVQSGPIYTEIVDMAGRRLYGFTRFADAGVYEEKLAVPLESGLYLIQCTSAGQQVIVKVIKH